MELRIDSAGIIHAVYAEDIPLQALGPLCITRASHVEPDVTGNWWADLAPVCGPRLGPFSRRSDAIGAESEWLLRHLLGS